MATQPAAAPPSPDGTAPAAAPVSPAAPPETVNPRDWGVVDAQRGNRDPDDIAVEDEPETPTPPPPTEFEFGGKKFQTREAAEHEYRSVAGRVANLENTNRDLSTKLTQIVQDPRIAAILTGQPPPPAGSAPAAVAPGPGQAPGAKGGLPDYLQAVDWAAYREIHDEHGPDVALIWALEKFAPALVSQIEAKFGKQLEPVNALVGDVEMVSAAQNLFNAAQTFTLNNDGVTIAYPEIQPGSPDLHGVVRTWREMQNSGALPVETALSPYGIYYAVLAYRHQKGSSAPVAAAPPAAGTVQPQAPPPPNPANAVVSGGGAATTVPAAQGQQSVEQQILDGIRGARRVSRDWGISR